MAVGENKGQPLFEALRWDVVAPEPKDGLRAGVERLA